MQLWNQSGGNVTVLTPYRTDLQTSSFRSKAVLNAVTLMLVMLGRHSQH